MMVIREHTADFELLRSSGELERADQCCTYVVQSPVRSPLSGPEPLKWKTAFGSKVLQCGCKVADAERRIGVADCLHVRMLGHDVLPCSWDATVRGSDRKTTRAAAPTVTGCHELASLRSEPPVARRHSGRARQIGAQNEVTDPREGSAGRSRGAPTPRPRSDGERTVPLGAPGVSARFLRPGEFLRHRLLDGRPLEESWVRPRPEAHRIGEGEVAKTLGVEEAVLDKFPGLLEHPAEVRDVPMADVAGKEGGYPGSERIEALVERHGSHGVVGLAAEEVLAS